MNGHYMINSLTLFTQDHGKTEIIGINIQIPFCLIFPPHNHKLSMIINERLLLSFFATHSLFNECDTVKWQLLRKLKSFSRPSRDKNHSLGESFEVCRQGHAL